MSNYKILRQVRGNQSVYAIRNKQVGSNDHIVHVGNGVFINKTHPEVYPMIEVADGFRSQGDATEAVEMLIKIDSMRGIDAWRATPQKPLLRVA
jgi:hypothetical protein